MSNGNSTGRAWAVTIFFTLFMAVMTYNLIIFPACAVDTMNVFGVGQAELTTLSSVTSVVGVFAGILFGRMLDTKSVRKSIMIFLAIGVVLFFARAFVTAYVPVMVLTFLASLSVGICQVAGPKVVGTWFPAEKVGTATSFLTAGAGIGSAGGFALGAILGIHNGLLSVGIAYLVLLVFWIAVGDEGPYKVVIPPRSGGSQQEGRQQSLFQPSLWMIIIAYSMAVTSSLLINSYMINAFVSKGLDPAGASAMGTLLKPVPDGRRLHYDRHPRRDQALQYPCDDRHARRRHLRAGRLVPAGELHHIRAGGSGRPVLRRQPGSVRGPRAAAPHDRPVWS